MTCSKCNGYCKLVVTNSTFNITLKSTSPEFKQEEKEKVEKFLMENVIADIYFCCNCLKIRLVDKTDYDKLDKFMLENGYKKGDC